MADKQEIMTVIEKLRTYEYGGERPIAVVGPRLGDTTKPPKKHLRVYAFGGLIGEIPPIGSECEFSLAADSYAGYLENHEKDEFRAFLKNTSAETICSDRYLELILKAAEKKFSNSTEKDGKNSINYKERRVENDIICKFMNTGSQSWAAIDMEFTLGGGSGRQDIVFYDASDNPSYIITELKYKLKSTNNIAKHIEDMKNLYAVKDKVRNELNRRMEYLCKHGLVSQAVSDSFLSTDKDKIDIRFGILYVDGGEENAEENVRIEGEALFDKLENDMKKLFYYQYCKTLDEIDIEEMKKKPLAEIMK